MTRIVWWGAFVGAAFWSVFAFVAYAVVDTVGTGASSYGTVPGFPPEPFTFAWIAAKAHGLGLSSIAAAWLIGLAMIFGSAALFQRLFGRRRPALSPPPRGWGSSIPSGSLGGTAPPTLKQRLFGR
jgi:hypothetical protein